MAAFLAFLAGVALAFLAGVAADLLVWKVTNKHISDHIETLYKNLER